MSVPLSEARISAPPPEARPRAAPVPVPAPAAPEPSIPFAQVLARLGDASAQGEAQVSRALGASKSGEALSPAELLSLQAGVYRYGEVVDLASRLVDRAQTGVKTVLQGQ